MEMTIMIAVGGILAMGITRAAQGQIREAMDNKEMQVALNLAKRQMAIMNNGALPAVVAETSLGADATFTDMFITQEVTSVAVSGSFNLRQVIVRVRNSSATGTVLILLRTYRTDLVTFGNGI
jgi:type II secretory pathway pseudopilin PulG